ncbi:hypothetical protein EVG20_g6475 [Dentipellis fragilis]|uniref:Uncharacterized protein n=1 Tax=Dentipellis fragilis TaxID=205917 RepID=A0A4Y9YKJ7_9AGAM|nr:hypothetical protein EVG20_g6475 [Dentipellis fragilis]
MHHKSHKITRKTSKGVVRDRVITRSLSRSQLDAASHGAGPSNASGSSMVPLGVPPGYSTPGLNPMHRSPHFPPPVPPSFLQHGQPIPVASSSATAPWTSAHGGQAGDTYVAVLAREQKAAQAAASPRLKRSLTDEERREKRVEKSQKKRARDVDDRVALNNVLPEDRRARSDPPGLVEVMRKAIEYIPEVRSDLEWAQQRIPDLQDALKLAYETNDVVEMLLGTRGEEAQQAQDEGFQTANKFMRLQGEIRQLRAQIAGG